MALFGMLNKESILFFQSFLLLDAEGTPLQELAAIEVDRKSNAIIDVFHDFADTASDDDDDDNYARRHVHGLNREHLKKAGFPSEGCLISEFKLWLAPKGNIQIFANGVDRERKLLGLKILELKLSPWSERRHDTSHIMARRYKELSIPILKESCSQHAHSSFVSAIISSNYETNIAKARHGYHCALYDVLELYFESLML
jgi:hypothetical protein